MTLPEFANVFGILAMQLRCTEADEAMIKAYFAVLKDLELEFVQMAATRFASAPGENAAWFPKTAEWKSLVYRIEVERRQALVERLRKLPSPLCLVCEDTGWQRDTATERVKTCDCRTLRRMELLGRRPWPQLPDAPSERSAGPR